MKNFNKKGGISIIGIILFAVLIILALNYFHISIRAVINSPSGQYNINYGGGDSTNLWDTYLAQPVSHLWNDVVLPFLKPLISKINIQPNVTP